MFSDSKNNYTQVNPFSVVTFDLLVLKFKTAFGKYQDNFSKRSLLLIDSFTFQIIFL